MKLMSSEFKMLWRGGGFDDVRVVAHALKGASANLGLIRMSDIAARIEIWSRSRGEESQASALADELRAAFVGLAQLSNVCAQAGATDHAELPIEPNGGPSVVSQLVNLLEASDAKALVFFRENQRELGTILGGRMGAVAAQMSRFEFPTALRTIQAP